MYGRYSSKRTRPTREYAKRKTVLILWRELRPLVRKYGRKAVREQLEANRTEYCKAQRAEQRKSLTAARREALKDAKANPPINFRMTIDSKPIAKGYRDRRVCADPEKRRAQALKDAAKLGLSIEEEAPNLAKAS